MDMMQGKMLMTKDLRMIPAKDALKGRDIIIYLFCASWAKGYQLFFNKLKEVYSYAELQKKKTIEVIYVSFDTDETEFRKDFETNHGPWLAVPLKDITLEELRWKYGVTIIPTLIVVKRDGYVITKCGKQELERLGLSVLVTWSDSSIPMDDDYDYDEYN